ncbi:hypothetical protein BDN71DRAFT_1559211 [Pleurotus eryngii]|uniref:Uncharacterized protein n=1 Tax=Pleurotus eryngii TaxID=5323 RepID=A0A9P5ZGK0_PLEER|nr:hypothetical protein BDN71DRAFT_1559211 [Pleurotus eryngii]
MKEWPSLMDDYFLLFNADTPIKPEEGAFVRLLPTSNCGQYLTYVVQCQTIINYGDEVIQGGVRRYWSHGVIAWRVVIKGEAVDNQEVYVGSYSVVASNPSKGTAAVGLGKIEATRKSSSQLGPICRNVLCPEARDMVGGRSALICWIITEGNGGVEPMSSYETYILLDELISGKTKPLLLELPLEHQYRQSEEHTVRGTIIVKLMIGLCWGEACTAMSSPPEPRSW